jgi:hypothetical protein
MIVNNRNNILFTHPVDSLVTLGTPNVGYFGENIDKGIFCPTLVTEMSSDYRSQQSTNTVIESTYLYQLNTAWTTRALPSGTLPWLAVAGTFCANPIRNADANTGCRDANPYNDAVVCSDSATFNMNGLNLPSLRWTGSYAHTHNSLLNVFDPAGCNVLTVTPLDAPLPYDPLVQTVKSFINAH